MTRDQVILRGAKRLVFLCDEHGTPNKFSAGEIADGDVAFQRAIGRYADEIRVIFQTLRPANGCLYLRGGRRGKGILRDYHPSVFDIDEPIDA